MLIIPACIIQMVMKPIIWSGGRGHRLPHTQINNATVSYAQSRLHSSYDSINDSLQSYGIKYLIIRSILLSFWIHITSVMLAVGVKLIWHEHKHIVSMITLLASSADSQMELLTFMTIAEAPVHLHGLLSSWGLKFACAVIPF